MAIEDKPLTGKDADREPSKPDPKTPPYRDGADRIAPPARHRPG